jgi:hypothetical protein
MSVVPGVGTAAFEQEVIVHKDGPPKFSAPRASDGGTATGTAPKKLTSYQPCYQTERTEENLQHLNRLKHAA